ncbi:MAG: transition metal transporter ATP-binding protein TroB [Chloroflexota bacterium]
MTIALSVRDLTVAYNDTPVLWDVDAEIPLGCMAAIVGPNGAGKSTFIKAALELTPRLTGEVRFFGEALNTVRQRVAYVPQRAAIDWDFPITVEEVAVMGAYGQRGWLRRPHKEDYQRVHDALDVVGLSAFRQRPIAQLSGGQQQRTFLARALVQQADMWILDEPFQGVDAETERALVSVLHSLKDKGKTIIAVHHDLQTLPRYFDYLFAINARRIAEGYIKDLNLDDVVRQTFSNTGVAV